MILLLAIAILITIAYVVIMHKPTVPFMEYPDVSLKKEAKVTVGERKLCQALEELYGKPFNRIRPEFLINPETGKKLEYDCYNDELKIAGEYNGIHHYRFPNWTNGSLEDFIQQRRRDVVKRQLSDKNGIYLITVPFDVPNDHIKNYVKKYLPD